MAGGVDGGGGVDEGRCPCDLEGWVGTVVEVGRVLCVCFVYGDRMQGKRQDDWDGVPS